MKTIHINTLFAITSLKFMCAILCITATSAYTNITETDDQNMHAQLVTPVSVESAPTTPVQLKKLSTFGLCSISLGVGLLFKQHPIAGATCMCLGMLSRKAPTSEGYQHIIHGFSQIQEAKTLQDLQGSAISILRGTCICTTDMLQAIEQQLAEK